MSNKKYGLVLPETGKSKTLQFQASRNVFGEDSDSDGETTKKPVLLRPSHNINRQAKVTQEKALVEDPTVYQYDEIYDVMAGSKKREKKKSKEEQKPRYIENLMKSANKRKIENERRIERQIQKEREEEGEEFKDKEVFVTSAYKKKLEEMRLEEEKEKREEYLENIGDVTKQRDLGGFYRHLYEQKLGEDKPTDSNKPSSKLNATEIAPITKTEHKETRKTEQSKTRNYRKRKSIEHNSHLSEGEIEDSDEEINRLNLDNIKSAKRTKVVEENIDADSDFSVDESSDEDNEKKIEKKLKSSKSEEHKPKTENKSDTPEKDSTPEKQTKKKTNDKDTPIKEEVVEVQPKIDIWKKRTVGEVFEEALKRYCERKAARGC